MSSDSASANGGPGLTDEVRVVGLAVSVWMGAMVGGWLGSSLPAVVPVAFLLVLLAAGTRIGLAPVLFMVLGLASFAVSTRDHSRYKPMDTGPLDASATVRSDPEPIGGGWRLEVQLESGQRLDAVAFGSAGFTAQQVEVGEQVRVTGGVRPIGDRAWLRSRHLVGRVSLDTIEATDDAGRLNRSVNALRRVIADGAVSFDSRAEALYLGLVIGDDRFQHLSQKAQFRAAGLTHLLAVSGQNVAFVLLVVRPLLMLFGYRFRLLLIVLVLLLFVAVTRAEPSVLRATAAAIVGAWATATGRSRSGLRALAGGVVAMIFLDPFLVQVVGFQLSVAASAGIIVLGPALVRRIRLPRLVAEPLAVTMAAQMAVAPLLVGYFGPLPLAAIPANLLAGWAAGAVMTAGLTVGPVAGLLASAGLPSIGALVQTPTRLLVDWIDLSARWSATVPLPRLDGTAMAITGAAVVLVAFRSRHVGFSQTTLVLGSAVLATTLFAAMPHRLTAPAKFDSGGWYIPADDRGPSLLIVPADCSSGLIDELLEHDVGKLDFVIAESGGRQAGVLVSAVVDVSDVGLILAPSLHRIRGATRVTDTRHIATSWGLVAVTSNGSGRSLEIRLLE